jgi:hypothetical protein
VTAQHDDYSATKSVSIHHRIDYTLEISRNEDIRKRSEKCGKASIISRRRRELFRPNLVRTALDGNGANLREVRLWNYLRVVRPVGGVYDVR